MIRAFVAIPMPPDTREALANLADRIPAGRPADLDHLHLTLAFLGDQPEDLLEEAHIAMEALPPVDFSIDINGLGSFGKWPPRLIHAAVAPSEPLTRLRKKVRQTIRMAGIDLGHERFVPHVTLARFSSRLSPEDSARLDAFLARHTGLTMKDIPVTGFALYRSTLRPDGAVHDILAEYPPE